MSTHDDLIVIPHRSPITAACIHHRDVALLDALHIAIGKSQLPQQFYPPNFKPHEVVGMIDHTHLVGLRITDAQPRLIHRGMIVGAGRLHCELQRGLRFSRKEVIPSRKSAVPRMPAFFCTAASIWASSSARA